MLSAVRRLVLLALALGALGALVAAGLSAAAAPTPYNGLFLTTVSGKAPQLNGKWLLSITATGAYGVAKEPSPTLLIGGTSTLSGHRIVFVDRIGPLACTGSQVRGTYTWVRSGKKLTLKPVRDTCSGRRAVLASAPFVKLR